MGTWSHTITLACFTLAQFVAEVDSKNLRLFLKFNNPALVEIYRQRKKTNKGRYHIYQYFQTMDKTIVCKIGEANNSEIGKGLP